MINEKLEKARAYEAENEKKITPQMRPVFHLTPRVGWMNDPNGFLIIMENIICSISITHIVHSGTDALGSCSERGSSALELSSGSTCTR